MFHTGPGILSYVVARRVLIYFTSCKYFFTLYMGGEGREARARRRMDGCRVRSHGFPRVIHDKAVDSDVGVKRDFAAIVREAARRTKVSPFPEEETPMAWRTRAGFLLSDACDGLFVDGCEG